MVDAGDFLAGPTDEDALKTEYLLRGLTLLGIHAVNLGEMDFARGQAYLRRLEADLGVPFVSSNLLVATTREPFVPPWRIVRVGSRRFLGREWGGTRIGIFGVLSNEHPPRRARRDDAPLLVADPFETARRMVAELAPRTDLIVALSHLGLDQAETLATRAPGIDIIVSGHGRLRLDGYRRAGESVVVHSRSEGKFIGDLALTLSREGRVMEVQAAQLPLDNEVPQDKELLAVEEAYHQAAEARRPATAAAPPIYAGASSCVACHAAQYADWSQTAHARAIESLRGKGEEASPGCVRCHVTGFGRPGGFTDLATTAGLAGVQCEACHGPGLGHVRFHQGKGAIPWNFRLAPGNTADDCARCHDGENDPDFDFDAALPQMMH